MLMQVAVAVIVNVVRLLACTWRFQVHGMDRVLRARVAGEMPAMALLHGRLACFIPYSSRPGQRPNAALVSRSKDGDFIVAIMKHFGFLVERGSGHRGGARALIDIIRAMRARPHVPMCFTVDGSRGPRGYLKAGVLLPPQKLGAPLYLLAAAPSRALIFRSWDRLCLPLPWSRIALYCSPPIHIPPTNDGESFEYWRRRVEDLLIVAHQRCARVVGYHDREPIRVSVGGESA